MLESYFELVNFKVRWSCLKKYFWTGEWNW